MKRLLVLCCAAAAACGVPDAAPERGPLVIAAVDTLIDTESGAIAYAVDLDVAPSGLLYVADYRANQLLRIDPATRDTVRIGRRGEGPGELDGPWTIRAVAGGVLVVDRGNGRVQRLTESGEFVSSTPVTPMVMRARPFIRADGGVVIGSGGRDSCLAVVFDSLSREVRRIGTPVVEPPTIADFGAIKAAINSGEIPADLRNDAIVAADRHGGVWLALQTEGEIRKYDAEGRLTWTLPVSEPEMAATRAAFFERNAAEKNPATFFSLRYFTDLAAVGDEIWVLLDTSSGTTAVILAVPPDGGEPRRIEVRGSGGATSLAVDEARSTLFLFTSHDAQLLAADLPG